MIYLSLFLSFFKIGLFTIGGGYAMIPLINAEALKNEWLTEEMLTNFIAISESTPGAFAINIATFVGATTGGFFGAVCATIGVVLPSLIIILIIAKFFSNLTEKPLIKDSFSALRPAVVGLILYAFVSLASTMLYKKTEKSLDYVSILLFIILLIIYKLPLKHKGKKISIHPAFLVLLSAGIGILFYGVIFI